MSNRSQIPTWWIVVVASVTACAVFATHELSVPENWTDVIEVTAIVFSVLVCFFRPGWSDLRLWLRLLVAFLIHSIFALGAVETGIIGVRGMTGFTLTLVAVVETALILGMVSRRSVVDPR